MKRANLSKKLFFKGAFLSLVVTIFVCGCAKETERTSPNMGSTSGGGSFADESSMYLLNHAVNTLVSELKFVNASGVPGSERFDKIIELVSNIKLETNRPAYRYDRELMFDNVVDQKGSGQIIATSLFFRAHAAVPVHSESLDQLSPYIQEIKLKLLHEAAHIFGIGLTEATDKDAESFAEKIISAIQTNNIVCTFQDPKRNFPYWGDSTGFSLRPDAKMLRFAFNRATGEGLVSRAGTFDASISALLKGKAVKTTSFLAGADIRNEVESPYPSRPSSESTVFPFMDWVPDSQSGSQLTYQFKNADPQQMDRLTLTLSASKTWSAVYESRAPSASKLDGVCTETSSYAHNE